MPPCETIRLRPKRSPPSPEAPSCKQKRTRSATLPASALKTVSTLAFALALVSLALSPAASLDSVSTSISPLRILTWSRIGPRARARRGSMTRARAPSTSGLLLIANQASVSASGGEPPGAAAGTLSSSGAGRPWAQATRGTPVRIRRQRDSGTLCPVASSSGPCDCRRPVHCHLDTRGLRHVDCRGIRSGLVDPSRAVSSCASLMRASLAAASLAPAATVEARHAHIV